MTSRDNNYTRPGTDEYFLLMCFLVAKRSHDAQTQCGTVIVRDGAILSTGYNGFLRGAKDDKLPNLRPEKYKYIVHSEANAIYNAVRHGINLYGATAYVTGQPCPECLKAMIQSGIVEIVYSSTNKHSTADKELEFFNELVTQHYVKVRVIKLDQKKIDLIRGL